LKPLLVGPWAMHESLIREAWEVNMKMEDGTTDIIFGFEVIQSNGGTSSPFLVQTISSSNDPLAKSLENDTKKGKYTSTWELKPTPNHHDTYLWMDNVGFPFENAIGKSLLDGFIKQPYPEIY
jgi:hypothetical protein